MNKIICCLVFCIALMSAVKAQSVKGIILDASDKTPVPGATVALKRSTDSTTALTTVTSKSGVFTFENVTPGNYSLDISSIGYEVLQQPIVVTDTSTDIGNIAIAKAAKVLSTVTVTSAPPPTQQKGDTSQFNASQFKVNPDATTEDLIKKMPGITVAKDGTVTHQGEQVRKVTVDGKDFFGDDATATLRNLPAEVVDKIQVFDRMSDQAQFTGFDDGNSQRSINIVTKSGVSNGQFGRIYAGYGTDDRYAAGGNVSFFKGNRRISIIGNFNNINQQNFASQDILGATSGGGGNRGGGGGGGGGNRGGGGGGGNFGGGNFGGGNNFSVGQQSGISKTNALGINFGDKWGKKVDIQGSYFFSNSDNNNDQDRNRRTIFDNGVQETGQSSFSNTKNNNHRVNMRLTYTIDSSNSIIIIPNISFQNNKLLSTSLTNTLFNGDSSNYSDVMNRSNRNGYNIRNTILYRHAFAKRGRTFSVNVNTTVSRNDGESYANGYYRFFKGAGIFDDDSTQNQFTDNQTNGYTLSGNVSYTEPLSAKSQLQISYQPSYTKNKADQQTFDFDGSKYSAFRPSLSNNFDNTTITHAGGVSYRLGPSRDNQFSAGLNIQQTELNSNRIFPTVTTVKQTFTNLLPNLMWRKKISPHSTFNIFYRANTNAPSVTQLQDVLNLSDPLNVSVGNPALKQSFNQIFTGRYIFTNAQKGQSFFANIFGQFAQNYISNVTYRIGADTIIQNEKISAELLIVLLLGNGLLFGLIAFLLGNMVKSSFSRSEH